MVASKDLTGQYFGYLRVIKRLNNTVFKCKASQVTWLCECICGNLCNMLSRRLRSEPNISCGCMKFTRGHGNTSSTPEEASLRGLLRRMQNSAKRRNLDWDIPEHLFKILVSSNCVWCGAPPSERYNVYISKNGYTQRKYNCATLESGWILYNGLDRIDNDRPYIVSNVQPCCKWCNFARNTRTEEEFKTWIYLVAKHQGML